MHADWPFLSRTTLSNMDMVLSKSDIAIARAMAELVTDAELGKRIFERVRQEWQACIDASPRHHAPADLAGDQSAAGALDPQPLPYSTR